jgi:hypothetical protein
MLEKLGRTREDCSGDQTQEREMDDLEDKSVDMWTTGQHNMSSMEDGHRWPQKIRGSEDVRFSCYK